MNKEKVDIKYLAGLYEGEGSASIFYRESADGYISIINVRMTDKEPVEAFSKYFGFGSVRYVKDYRNPDWMPSYDWRVTGRNAAIVASQILPFILSARKRSALKCVIDFSKTLRNGHNLLVCVKNYRASLYEQCKIYNAKGKERQIFLLENEYESLENDDKQLLLL